MRKFKFVSKIALVGLMVLLSASCGKSPYTPPTETSAEKSPDIISIRYSGQDGKSALEILKGKYEVKTESFSYGEMVKQIGKVTADNQHYWSFYVNGVPASVGAGDYISKNSDSIEWKLEKINPGL